MLQRRADIVLGHDGDDDRALAAVGDDEIHHGVARVLSHRLADLGQAHPLVLSQLRVQHRREHDAVAAAGAVPLILPRGSRAVGHVGLDPIAQRRIAEPRQHLVEAALAHPQRQAGVEAVRRARVGILVRRHVQAARMRRLNPRQDLRHLAPVGFVRRLEMPDLRGEMCLLGNREHFVERFEDAAALRSLMGEVDAAVSRRDLRQRDDLVEIGKPIGHVLKRRAQAERALFHRPGRERLHRVQFRRRRAAIVLADDEVAQSAGAHERPDVDRGMRTRLEPLEIIAERPPILGDPEMLGVVGAFLDHPVVHRRNRAALAGHLGRHALENLARGAVVHEHVELRLAEEIDEPRRDDQVRGVEARGGGCAGERSNRRDAIPDETDVAHEPGTARAVDDAAVRDQHVEAIRGPLGTDRHARHTGQRRDPRGHGHGSPEP